MVDADGVTCPLCGAPISIGDIAARCPRCPVTDTRGGPAG
jgi:hypothetical protein